MKKEKSKLRTLFSKEGLKNLKEYAKTDEGKKSLKDLGKSLKELGDTMDIYK